MDSLVVPHPTLSIVVAERRKEANSQKAGWPVDEPSEQGEYIFTRCPVVYLYVDSRQVSSLTYLKDSVFHTVMTTDPLERSEPDDIFLVSIESNRYGEEEMQDKSDIEYYTKKFNKLYGNENSS